LFYLPRQKQIKTGPISKALLKGEDPCIMDAVTEGLLPLLRLDSLNETVQFMSFKPNEFASNLNSLSQSGLSSSTPIINASTSPTGPSIMSSYINNYGVSTTATATLPFLPFEQNYSQALSDIVAAL
jgi:hypothetical protein